eukprot:118313_1
MSFDTPHNKKSHEYSLRSSNSIVPNTPYELGNLLINTPKPVQPNVSKPEEKDQQITINSSTTVEIARQTLQMLFDGQESLRQQLIQQQQQLIKQQQSHEQ